MKRSLTISLILFFFAATVMSSQVTSKKRGHSSKQQSPSSSSSSQTKPVVKTHVPIPRAKIVKLLPDLEVEKIWLDKGRVAFTLKNSGKGIIPDKGFKKGHVSVIFGRKTHTYAFATVDLKGVLKKPGESVSFTTQIKPAANTRSQRVTITVIVDASNQIREHNEGNNKKTVQLSVPKLMVPVKAVGRPTPKTRRSKSPTRQAASGSNALKCPPIAVERIYLRHGTVHVRLKNSGPKTLAKTPLKSIPLRLTLGNTTRTWHLNGINLRRYLSRPGSSYDFDTGIAVKKQGLIVARLGEGRQAKTLHVFMRPTPLTVLSVGHAPKGGVRTSNGPYVKTPAAGKRPVPLRPGQGSPPNHNLPQPNPEGPQTGTAALIPILKITKITVTPESPRAKHDMVTIHVTVKNIGGMSCPYRCEFTLGLGLNIQDTIYGFYYLLPKSTYSKFNIPLLDPGEEVHFSPTVTIPKSGYHTIIAWLHDTQNFDEENPGPSIIQPAEGSWRVEKTFYVREAPQPTDIVLEKVERAPDGRLKISMHNTGYNIPDPDFNHSYVKVTINNGAPRLMKLSEIDPTGLLKIGWPAYMSPMVHVSFIWPARTGAHYQDGINPSELDESTVRIHVNYNGSIAETNRWNDIIEKHFSSNPANVSERIFGNLPDLIVCSFKIIRFVKGQHYPINVVVKNVGPAPAGPSKLYIWEKGHTISSHDIPALDPGDNYEVFRDTFFHRTDTYQFNALINGNGQDETDLDNNIWHGQIFVLENGGSSVTHTVPRDFGCSNNQSTSN